MSSPKADDLSTGEESTFRFGNKSNNLNSATDLNELRCSDVSDESGNEYSMDTTMEKSEEDDSSDRDCEKSIYSIESSDVSWGTSLRTMLWIQEQKNAGTDPRKIILQALGSTAIISEHIPEATLWDVVAEVLTDPPRRHKLRHINTIEDVVELLRKCKNIMVLTGAGVSVSCGIPDFRSKDGIYSRLAKEFPNLPDPQSMFDIQYFCRDPRPFYQFAREIYPGQFKPSTCHQFIKMLEDKGKLLRNYTQNIDTLERAAGITNVVECHGSFATATCTKCKYKLKADHIREEIFAQQIPMCPECRNIRIKNNELSLEDLESLPFDKLVDMGIMKPDIVFFGEGLGGKFHKFIANDKNKCDLLIVIGSSLRVHPVALIPRSISPNVPQILINREQLGHMTFDVELLGDSDTIVMQLCKLLGGDFAKLSDGHQTLKLTRELKPRLNYCKQVAKKFKSTLHQDEPGFNSFQAALLSNTSLGSFCDSGFESTSSSLNNGNSLNHSNRILYTENSSESCPSTSKQCDNDDTSKWLISKPYYTCSANDSVHKLSPVDSAAKFENVSIGPLDDKVICRTTTSNFNLRSSNSSNDINVADTTANDEYTNMNLADYLPDGTFYNHSMNGVYIFPGAQASFSSSEENSSESESDGEEKSSDDSIITTNNHDDHSPLIFEIVSKKRKHLPSDESADSDEYDDASCDFRYKRKF